MNKVILSILAVIILIGASAFSYSGNESEPETTAIYWIFNGNPNSQTDIENPLMYEEAPGGQATCTTGSELCNILAERDVNDTDHPDLSTEVVPQRKFKN